MTPVPLRRMMMMACTVSMAGSVSAVGSSELVVGGPALDRGVGIASTRDGGYVMVGVTASMGSGGDDAYLVRLDRDEQVIWQKALGGPGEDAGWAVVETPDGGLVIGGFSDAGSAGGLDCSLWATDSRGELLWSNTYGGAKDESCWALESTDDGGYILAGETASSSAGERDCLLIRTDSSGARLWSRTYGGAKDDRCFSVTAAADGGFVVAGQTFSYGAGDRDAWVLKTDSGGVVKWSKTHGGEASDVAHSVVPSGDGSYLVTGYTTSLASTPDDPMLLKFSGDGSMEWSRIIEMEGHNRAISAAPNSKGGFCLAGLSVDGSPRGGSAVVARIDSDGRLLWTKKIARTTRGESFGYGVTGTRTGGCAMTGHTTVGSAGHLDVLFASLDSEGR